MRPDYCQSQCTQTQSYQSAPLPLPDEGYKPWGGAAGVEAGRREANQNAMEMLQMQQLYQENQRRKQQFEQQQRQEQEIQQLREQLRQQKQSVPQQNSYRPPVQSPQYEDAAKDYALAKNLWGGENGYPKNRLKAMELLKSSSAAGFPTAMFQLGKFYRIGEGVSKDESYGRILIERAARAGHQGAEAELQKLGVASTN